MLPPLFLPPMQPLKRTPVRMPLVPLLALVTPGGTTPDEGVTPDALVTPGAPVTPGVTTPGTLVTPGKTTPGTPVTPGETTPGTPVTPGETTPGALVTPDTRETRRELFQGPPRSAGGYNTLVEFRNRQAGGCTPSCTYNRSKPCRQRGCRITARSGINSSFIGRPSQIGSWASRVEIILDVGQCIAGRWLGCEYISLVG